MGPGVIKKIRILVQKDQRSFSVRLYRVGRVYPGSTGRGGGGRSFYMDEMGRASKGERETSEEFGACRVDMPG